MSSSVLCSYALSYNGRGGGGGWGLERVGGAPEEGKVVKRERGDVAIRRFVI